MNFDRNTVIGFIVLALLFGGYFWWTSKEQAAARVRKSKTGFYTRAMRQKMIPLPSKPKVQKMTPLLRLRTAGGFQKAIIDAERTVVINNNVLEITFTSKGGQPKKVKLEKIQWA